MFRLHDLRRVQERLHPSLHVLLSALGERSLVLLQKLLEGSGLQANLSQQVQAGLQILSSIVSGLSNEQMVLEQLLSNRLGHGKEALVGLRVDLDVLRLLTSGLLELLEYTRRRVVVGSSEDLSAQELGALLDGRDDVLACKQEIVSSIFSIARIQLLTHIFANIDQREARVLANGIGKRVHALLVLPNHAERRVVAHEVARQDESGGHADGADVLLDLGLVVEVRDVLEAAARLLGRMQQRREDQVLDAGILARIGDILTLDELRVRRRLGTPGGRGDEEDGVRAFDGRAEGGGILHARLKTFCWLDGVNADRTAVWTYRDHLDALGLKGLGSGLGRIAGDASELELL